VRGIAAISTGLAFLLAVAVQVDAQPARTSAPTPQRYYLALGDSLVYGIQPAKIGRPPSGFHTGFVDVFAARLRTITPKLRVVNYGCPGESTGTFVAGGCPWLAEKRKLHNAFRGTQLAAALSFLRAHHGQVSPITVTLFGNDVAAFEETCKDDLSCIRRRAPQAIAQFRSRLTTILGRLRAAAPQAVIVVTSGWNFNVDDLKGTDPLVRSANAALARAARGVRARYADLFPIFSPATSLKRKATLCRLTFICSGDPHPTDAGYRAIGAAVFAASGFG
jgi:lysophospholipase L1-like esterase